MNAIAVAQAGEKLYGQWVGLSTAQDGAKVRIVVNIEKRAPTIAQILSINIQNTDYRLVTTAVLKESADKIVIKSPDTRVFDLATGNLIPIKEYFQRLNVTQQIEDEIEYTITERGRVIAGTWKTNLGGTGNFHLTNTTNDPAQKADHTFNWREFKQFIADNYLNSENVIFRGQPDNSFKLRTLSSFATK